MYEFAWRIMNSSKMYLLSCIGYEFAWLIINWLNPCNTESASGNGKLIFILEISSSLNMRQMSENVKNYVKKYNINTGRNNIDP